MEKVNVLYTAQELEELLGRKYFYRQSLYRLAEDGKIASYQINGILYFSSQDTVLAVLKRLVDRIRHRYPRLSSSLRVKFEENESKVITVYGFPDRIRVIVNTDEETEEDLLNKIEHVGKEVKSMPDMPVRPPDEPYGPPPPPPPNHGDHHRLPPPHHQEIMDALRRIEERLAKIEERV